MQERKLRINTKYLLIIVINLPDLRILSLQLETGLNLLLLTRVLPFV